MGCRCRNRSGAGSIDAEDLLGRNINEIEWDKRPHLNQNENKSQQLRENLCLVFEPWLKRVEERDADALIGLVHEDF